MLNAVVRESGGPWYGHNFLVQMKFVMPIGILVIPDNSVAWWCRGHFLPEFKVYSLTRNDRGVQMTQTRHQGLMPPQQARFRAPGAHMYMYEESGNGEPRTV